MFLPVLRRPSFLCRSWNGSLGLAGDVTIAWILIIAARPLFLTSDCTSSPARRISSKSTCPFEKRPCARTRAARLWRHIPSFMWVSGERRPCRAECFELRVGEKTTQRRASRIEATVKLFATMKRHSAATKKASRQTQINPTSPWKANYTQISTWASCSFISLTSQWFHEVLFCNELVSCTDC